MIKKKKKKKVNRNIKEKNINKENFMLLYGLGAQNYSIISVKKHTKMR